MGVSDRRTTRRTKGLYHGWDSSTLPFIRCPCPPPIIGNILFALRNATVPVPVPSRQCRTNTYLQPLASPPLPVACRITSLVTGLERCITTFVFSTPTCQSFGSLCEQAIVDDAIYAFRRTKKDFLIAGQLFSFFFVHGCRTHGMLFPLMYPRTLTAWLKARYQTLDPRERRTG